MLEPSTPTRRLSEVSIAIALAAVLSLLQIKLPHLIYGGSVSLHMLPLLLVSVRHGLRAGVAAGTAYGIVNFLLTPIFLHPIQLILDYPVAFGCLGTAVAFGRAPISTGRLAAGFSLACIFRYFAHAICGFVYFGHLAPEGTPAWSFSLGYNASYLLPETILTLLVGLPIARRLAIVGAPNRQTHHGD